MQIQGPLKIGVLDNSGSSVKELHLDFTREFQAQDLVTRTATFRGFITTLNHDAGLAEDRSPDQQGMLTIAQIAEQLLPHIEADEIVLGETIVIEIQSDNPLASIVASSQSLQ